MRCDGPVLNAGKVSEPPSPVLNQSLACSYCLVLSFKSVAHLGETEARLRSRFNKSCQRGSAIPICLSQS